MSKKTGKRGPRGPYKKRASTKKLKKVDVTFFNSNPFNTRTPGIKVATTCISMDANTAKSMEFKANSYVVVGKKGNEIYLTLKPKNVIAGHKLIASKTGRLTAHIKASAYKLKTGVYQPGTGVLADLPTEQGEFVEIVAYPLVTE